jgi:hypothetical protein
MHTDDSPVRDSRDGAPIVTMDLSRSINAIHADLRKRWPDVTGLWWELDEGNKTGWAYRGDDKILAKLLHYVG